jgi:hypothetical protein
MVSLWMENGSLEQYMRVKSAVLTPSQRLHWVDFSLFFVSSLYQLPQVKDVAGGLKYRMSEFPHILRNI